MPAPRSSPRCRAPPRSAHSVPAVRVLDISVNLGASASPAQLESFVRGVRVAVDVGRDAELGRVRRTAAEQMKFPTDDELIAAGDRPSQNEEGLAYRASRLLE